MGHIGPSRSGKVMVLGFAEPSINPKVGIVCEALMGTDEFQVPLVGLHVGQADPNVQQVEDYTHWLWDVQEYEEDNDTEESPQYPIGTVALYGPDDTTTTKIVAAVIKEEEAEPILNRWVATDVTTNPRVKKEIDRFFKTHGVMRVGMSEGNMGCPHEEGMDFPLGGDCPFCPWWKGKQGSGAKG